MTRVDKHPDEEFDIAASIRLVQATGEEIELGDSSVSAVDKDGADVTATLLDTSTLRVTSDPAGGENNALTVLLRAGSEAASPYRVEFEMATSLDQVWKQAIRVFVRDFV